MIMATPAQQESRAPIAASPADFDYALYHPLAEPAKPPTPEHERLKREREKRLRELVVLRGRRALLLDLLWHRTATADVVRKAVRIPDGIKPNILGSVPQALVNAGIIRRTNVRRSREPGARGRLLVVWRLVDFNAASDWLFAHPPQPDPLPYAD